MLAIGSLAILTRCSTSKDYNMQLFAAAFNQKDDSILAVL